jgi:hypothetical protein
VIRTGIVLPTFRESPEGALEVAHEALAAGVDGVFCYDHIWPIGEPERPALAPFPLLATLAASVDVPSTSGVGSGVGSGDGGSGGRGGRGGPFFGTLVARVGLVPNDVLLGQFSALDLLAPGRVIAGLGTGDRLSKAENLACGIPFTSSAERRREMLELAQTLGGRDIAVWIAGGMAARTEETLAAGAALNVWEAPPSLVASRSQEPDAVEVTWAGPPIRDDVVLREVVQEVGEAGATWVVFGWPTDPVALVAAARDAEAALSAQLAQDSTRPAHDHERPGVGSSRGREAAS